MLQACAGVYAAGRTPRWEALTGPATPPVDLPSYPWQRERFWLRDPPEPASPAPPAQGLLGARRPGGADGTITFDARWPSDGLAWVADHEVGGSILMPATGLLEILRAAAGATLGGQVSSAVADFVVHQPLLLEPGIGRAQWRTVASPDGDQVDVAIWTETGSRWDGRDVVSVHRVSTGRSDAGGRAVARRRRRVERVAR